MEPIDDNRLLQELRQGSLAAYEQLFMRYYKLLCLQAFHLLKDEMEAEDLVQTLFIEIWDRQLLQQVNSSLHAYLKRAVMNRCLNLLDKQKTACKRLHDYTYFQHETEKHKEADTQSLGEQYNELLQTLPLQRQEAFRLVYIKNKKYKEAAIDMGITVNSVKTHLKLALKVLRERFVKF